MGGCSCESLKGNDLVVSKIGTSCGELISFKSKLMDAYVSHPKKKSIHQK
ncbi:hypothetical protein Hanom_Chr14g01289841 [Helianthus anomalus]